MVRDNAEARPGRFVLLEVEDCGSGIEPQTLEHLFEPFFTTKDVGQGTGLGLSTVHGIVKQHEGWVDVQTELGAGSSFRVYFPASEKPEPKPDIDQSSRGQLGGDEVILVVEDEKPLRNLIRVILETNGYRVLLAPNGVEALDIWTRRSSEIDLLLTDLVMPGGMTGGQLAEKIRSRDADLRVVFSSGYSPEALGSALDRFAVSAYLQKPYAPEKLLEVVRKVLDTKFPR